MKHPNEPKKPYAPYKPASPPERIAEKTSIGKIKIDTYIYYTMDNLVELIKDCSGYNDQDVEMEFEIRESYGEHEIIIDLFTREEVNNPHFDAMTKQFEKDMLEYNADYKKYVVAKKKYDEEMAIYQAELDKWQLEQSKAQVKKLEAKIKKQEKNK